jgi:glycosyltransferase involved in cell wall biosynthesis
MKPGLNIAHVTDFYLPRLGGIELHVRDLALRQQAQGHAVTIVTSSPSEGVTDTELPVVRVTEHLRRPRVIHPRAPFAGARALLDGKYDVVHVHVAIGSPLAFWAALACGRAGLPTVVTVHSLWGWANPIMRLCDLAGGFSSLPLQWTAVSGVAAQHVQRVLGSAADVTVIPNGINPAGWDVARAERPDDEVLLVAVMRMATRKRPLPLLRMLSAVRAQVPAEISLRAVLVGDGPATPAMQRYVARHRLQTWVSMPGRQDREQIRDLYRTADAFLAPADLESFGIAALEARCAGIPVVAKAGTGIADFVTDERDGLLAEDDAAMVRAVVRLCTDPELRVALAGHAGDVPERVDWTSTLARTASVYERAAAAAGRPLPVAAVG